METRSNLSTQLERGSKCILPGVVKGAFEHGESVLAGTKMAHAIQAHNLRNLRSAAKRPSDQAEDLCDVHRARVEWMGEPSFGRRELRAQPRKHSQKA